MQRGVQVKVWIVHRKLDDLAEPIVGAHQRAVQPEGDRAVRHQLQRVVVDFADRARVCSAWHQAHRPQPPFARLAQPNVVRPRQPATHEDAVSRGADVGEVGRAAGDRQIELATVENPRAPTVPAANDVGYPLAQQLGNKESAIEQDGIGYLPGGLQKGIQMPGDGWVRHVREAQLAHDAAPFLLWPLARLGEGKEPIQSEIEHFLALQLAAQGSADQRRAGAEHGDLHAGALRLRQQQLLGGGALAAQRATLTDGQRRPELRLDQPSEGQVEIVAAQQQVLANGRAREVHRLTAARDPDQAEVAGAATHVAHQHDLAVLERRL